MTFQSKPCPFCKNDVDSDAIICSRCGHHFDVIEDDGTKSEFLTNTMRLSVPNRWFMLGSCVLLILGSLLPWGVIETFMGRMEIRGAAGDGALTAGIGAVLVVIALLSDKHSKDRRLAFIAGGVISLFLLIPKVITLLKPVYESSIFPGLILAVCSAVLVVISALITRSKDVPL